MDRDYLLKKIHEFGEVISEDNSYIKFSYKSLDFICMYEENDFPIFLLESDEIIKYPHVVALKEEIVDEKKYSYICLFETESIVQYYLSSKDKIKLSIQQFIKLFNLSENEIKNEIKREYIYHWKKNTHLRIASNIAFNEPFKYGKIFKYKRKNSTEKTKLILSKTFPYTKENFSITESNCICLSIKNFKKILPPTMIDWSSDNLKELFFSLKQERFSNEEHELLDKLYVKNKITIFLRIIEYEFFEIGLEIQFKDSDRKKFRDKIVNDEIISISFISVENQTIENSLHRNGQSPTTYKKVILVGVGSLGSYIASELPKHGVKELLLIDNDELCNDNISRHYLGYEFINSNKATAMECMLSISYPQLKFSAIKEKITRSNVANILDSIDYDLIIVATGNEDMELMINDYIMQRKTFIPAMYCWLEGNAVGSHVFMMSNKKDGCFKCMLKQEINYLTSVNDILKTNGCGGTYSEYGMQIIYNTLPLVLDMLHVHGADNNYVLSFKNFSIKESNYAFSDLYYSQNCSVSKQLVSKEKGCDCNDKV